LIGERTRKAIAAKRSAGTLKGVIGRAGWKERPPMLIPDHVRARIIELRLERMSRNSIANQLTREGVPTAAGGKRWYPSTILRVLETANREEA
jgi:DNA invertase Pin-like site-specific DNA recombinase